MAVPASADGELGAAKPVDTSGVSLDGLLGFSGDETVAVSAYLLESGSIQRVLDIQLDGGSPVSVTALPSPGENWRGSGTLAVSDQALRSGSTDYGSRVWPWSLPVAAGDEHPGRPVLPGAVDDEAAAQPAPHATPLTRTASKTRRGEAVAAILMSDCRGRPQGPGKEVERLPMNTRTIAIAALVIAVIILLIFLF